MTVVVVKFVVDVVGVLGAVGAVVVVTGTIVVLLFWLLDQQFAVCTVLGVIHPKEC